MPPIQPIPASAWVTYGLLAGIGVLVYACVARHIVRQGGKVRVCDLALPELLMSLVVAGFFVMGVVGAILFQPKVPEPVTMEKVLRGAPVLLILAGGVLAFLHYVRRLHARQFLGLDQTTPLAAMGWVAGLFLAVLPIIFIINLATIQILKDGYVAQPLVNFFKEVVSQSDLPGIATMFVLSTIVAPCCEEFLFRAFLYGVWKRYLGPLGAGFLASLLFAATHVSLPSFVGLFVLAVCLNLADQRTGSLLVPIGLHACFNFSSLLILYVQVRSPSLLVPS